MLPRVVTNLGLGLSEGVNGIVVRNAHHARRRNGNDAVMHSQPARVCGSATRGDLLDVDMLPAGVGAPDDVHAKSVGAAHEPGDMEVSRVHLVSLVASGDEHMGFFGRSLEVLHRKCPAGPLDGVVVGPENAIAFLQHAFGWATAGDGRDVDRLAVPIATLVWMASEQRLPV